MLMKCYNLKDLFDFMSLLMLSGLNYFMVFASYIMKAGNILQQAETGYDEFKMRIFINNIKLRV